MAAMPPAPQPGTTNSTTPSLRITPHSAWHYQQHHPEPAYYPSLGLAPPRVCASPPVMFVWRQNYPSLGKESHLSLRLCPCRPPHHPPQPCANWLQGLRLRRALNAVTLLLHVPFPTWLVGHGDGEATLLFTSLPLVASPPLAKSLPPAPCLQEAFPDSQATGSRLTLAIPVT